MNELHETFKIIKPFLAEHGIKIGVVEDDFYVTVEDKLACFFYCSWTHGRTHGMLCTKDSDIWVVMSHGSHVDLHEPGSLDRLVESILRYPGDVINPYGQQERHPCTRPLRS